MGKYNEPLNEEGKKQARIVRDKLKDTKLDFIITSLLLRAKKTAVIINEQRNILIIYDDRISERDFGEFEGQMTKNFDFLLSKYKISKGREYTKLFSKSI